jgi:preprotein translocase subunit YajC
VQDLVTLLPLVGIAVLFWFLLIRPQAKRQRELARMQSSLEVGDTVMLTSGVFATVREFNEDGTARVEIAPGVVIKVARQAVGQVVRDEPTDRDEQDEQAGPDGPVSEES